MNTRTPDESRIRRRIAEIDQHISVLMKEREELVFAERVIDRLRDPAELSAPPPAAALSSESSEPDSIEDALLMLESKAGVHTSTGAKTSHW